MSLGASQKIIDTLNTLGFDLKKHPGNKDEILEPGFYLNEDMCQIEHWSGECEYNKVMGLHDFKNESGLIRDGWQSTLPFEDIEGLVNSIEIWDRHLQKYGVRK